MVRAVRSEKRVREELALARKQRDKARRSAAIDYPPHMKDARMAERVIEILEWVLEERDWTDPEDSVEKSGEDDGDE